MARPATSAALASENAPTPAPLRPWPADVVERWSLDRIKPYPRNARLHSDDQVEKIAASMLHFGVTVPVLVDEEGVLIYGHGRLLGARLLVSRGHRHFAELPTAVARGWPETDKQAYRIADNELALLSEWDVPALQAEAASLQLAGFHMPLLGLDSGFFSGITAATRPRGDPEQAPVPAPDPFVRPGDLWLLDRHRLLCGDATRKNDVDRLLKGCVPPNIMVTDPPYGVEYDPAWRVTAGASSKAAVGKVKNDDRADWSRAYQLFPGVIAYVWHGGLHAGAVERSLIESGYQIRAQIVWVKTRPVLSRGAYHWQHEPALVVARPGAREDDDGAWWRFDPEGHGLATYAVEQGEKASWRGGRKQSTVWTIEHIKSETGHGTQKPIACMQRPIENHTSAGDGVYDPFVGSGTTIMAAEITARRCFAIDLDPAYVQVAIERWQAFSQKAATLDGDGRAFDVIRSERSKKPKR